MRKWKYNTPDENGYDTEVIVSDKEILENYGPWWYKRMKHVFGECEFDKEECIRDWVNIHWAWEA